ncbi:MAG: CRTAC1 family protein [Deltaproteobacteria bacterium]|nr:CRTAC1 family protein [Deltaproteobacteria bacterium]
MVADVAGEDTQAQQGDAAGEDTQAQQGDAAIACPPGARFKPGSAAFVEATAPWGLSGVQGARMNVVDYDNDGWADLLVHGGGVNQFQAGGNRDTWLLRNTGKGGFEDVTQSSGLLQRRLKPSPQEGVGAAAFCAGDLDNDGDVDFFLARSMAAGSTDTESNEVLLNDGKGHFVLGPADNPARAMGQVAVPTSAALVDFDRDGILDVWVVHNMPGGAQQPLQDRLWRGDGSGRFTDVTKASGLGTQPWSNIKLLNNAKGHSWAWAATACDLNNDGYDELLTASYGRVPNHLWRAEPGDNGVKFINESVDSSYAYDAGLDWTDNLSAQCHCKDVPTDPGCDKVPSPNPAVCAQLKSSFGPSYRWNHAYDREPWRLGGNSGTTVCADVDNDGWFDLLTNEIKHSDVGSSSDESELLFNLGDPLVRLFRMGNTATGLVREHKNDYWDNGDITSAIYDFDNDGWLDVHIAASDYPGNRALLWRQTAQRKFEAVAPADFFERYRAAGVAAADFDHDGDIDVVTGHTRMRCEGGMGADCQPDNQIHLHLNQLGGHYVAVLLRGGEGSNGAAVGARVAVSAGGIHQMSYVDGGHGQGNTQRDPTLHFGLGDSCNAELTVTWPDAKHTVEKFAVAADKRYRLTQGGKPVEQ